MAYGGTFTIIYNVVKSRVNFKLDIYIFVLFLNVKFTELLQLTVLYFKNTIASWKIIDKFNDSLYNM